MTISKKSWSKYVAALRKINDTATQKMLYFIDQFGMPSTEEELEDFIFAALNISEKYGIAAAELAAQMYDATALAEGVIKEAAELAPTPTYGEVAKTVKGTLKTENPKIVAQSVGRLVKQTGVDTTMHNAIRDGAEWAWIPQGETCAFCLTLASRDWQKASKKVLKGGHAEHIHANCDCTFAIRFDRKTNVEGYTPKRYLRMYEEAPLDHWNTPDGKPPAGDAGAERDTPKNRINAMRRAAYKPSNPNGEIEV